MKKLIYILSVVVVGCSSSIVNDELEVLSNEKKSVETSEITEVKRTEVVKDKIDFNTFYKNFTTAIITKDTAVFNALIHRDYGVYFIESSGAMPMFSKTYFIEKFIANNTKKPFFELDFSKIKEMPVNESLPELICDNNIYDKQGCFAQEINLLNKSQIWSFTELNDKQKQEIEVIANTIKYSVINTSNYTFYFSFIYGNWYVTFIDLRTPCSA